MGGSIGVVNDTLVQPWTTPLCSADPFVTKHFHELSIIDLSPGLDLRPLGIKADTIFSLTRCTDPNVTNRFHACPLWLVAVNYNIYNQHYVVNKDQRFF
jgi:hypothetical protein